MATIREQLKKITELYVPRAGDEREFVAKHRVEIFDKQGKDSISQETPYELILKNVAAIKAPPRAGEDHGHDAPGESEAAYHIPESREAIIAKLSEMMGNEKDEDDEDEDEDDEEDDEDEKEMKEAKKQRTSRPTGIKVTYHSPKTGKTHDEIYFSAKTAKNFEGQHRKAGRKVVKRELQYGYAVTKTNEDIDQIDEAEREAGYKMPPHVKAAQKKFDLQSAIKRSRQAETHSPDVEGTRNYHQSIKKK